MFLVLINILISLLPSNNSIEHEIDTYLKKYLNDYTKYEYTLEENLRDYKSVQINYNRASNRIGNNFFLPVRVVDKYGIEREKFIQVEIKIYEKVLVTAKPIVKGDLIDESNTEWKMKDITGLNQEPIKNNIPGAIVSKYDLQPGEILCNDFIENSPVLEVGDPVSLYYGSGSVAINFSGYARQSGAAGDIIKVRSNGRQYTAKIINSNKALIIE